MPTMRPGRCPDCEGTGKYVGFLVEEECRLCEGNGTVYNPEPLERLPGGSLPAGRCTIDGVVTEIGEFIPVKIGDVVYPAISVETNSGISPIHIVSEMQIKAASREIVGRNDGPHFWIPNDAGCYQSGSGLSALDSTTGNPLRGSNSAPIASGSNQWLTSDP